MSKAISFQSHAQYIETIIAIALLEGLFSMSEVDVIEDK